MTINFRRKDGSQFNLTDIRLLTVYPKTEVLEPEIVLHSNLLVPQENIPLTDLESITVIS